MYKIETHLHTNLVSPCGKLSPREILEGYSKAGYHGIVVTDHLMEYTFQWMKVDNMSNDEKWKLYQKGYEELRQFAPEYGIQIYFGVELTFEEEPRRDYLVYGCPVELLKDVDTLFYTGIRNFYPVCHEAGGVVIQAHPYRSPSEPVPADLVDGIEICNTHPRHENRNDLALLYAEDHPALIRFSGSDAHRTEDMAGGGIMTEKLPADERELAEIIRAEQFACIIPDRNGC